MREATKRKVDMTLKELLAYAEKHGYWPSRSEWNEYAKEHDLYTDNALYQKVRLGWAQLRKKYGYPSNQKHFSKEECIQALQEASKYLGETFTRYQYNAWAKAQKTEYPTYGIISRRFGGFNRAKEAAGLIPNELINTKNTFTDEELIESLRRCAEEIGDKFSDEEYMRWREKDPENRPHIETIRSRFGGINQAKKLISLSAYRIYGNYRHERKADQTWKESFFRFIEEALAYQQYEKWKQQHPDAPTQETIIKEAGSYYEALMLLIPEYLRKLERVQKGQR